MIPKKIIDYDSEKFNEFYEEVSKDGVLIPFMALFNLENKLNRTKIFYALLCGASGVGKTEIGRLLHKHISPNSTPIKFW